VERVNGEAFAERLGDNLPADDVVATTQVLNEVVLRARAVLESSALQPPR